MQSFDGGVVLKEVAASKINITSVPVTLELGHMKIVYLFFNKFFFHEVNSSLEM